MPPKQNWFKVSLARDSVNRAVSKLQVVMTFFLADTLVPKCFPEPHRDLERGDRMGDHGNEVAPENENRGWLDKAERDQRACGKCQ